MESPGSYIRSAARATFSEYRSVPIRWRLAGGSAGLTFVILASFAAIVGILTNRQVRTQFRDQQSAAFEQLTGDLTGKLRLNRAGKLTYPKGSLREFAGPDGAQIRIFNTNTGQLLQTQKETASKRASVPAPSGLFATPSALSSSRQDVRNGYLVSERQLRVRPASTRQRGGGSEYVTLLYGVPEDTVDHTIARVQAFLLIGVLGGTVLALLAGLFVSERAMSPIKELTAAAREIRRTRDPSLRIPHPEAEDEIAELARTLEGMLGALEAARSETQTMLDRQREFVADASHELRTPLTSVLANLDLLTEELDGEQAETAEAALRSTRRMRRLVGDLLLLARADARRENARRPTDVGEVLLEAASELGPIADRHQLTISALPAYVDGVRDELHRLLLNLMENALRHTPPGTSIHASTETAGEEVVIEVSDDGPGIPPELCERVFERFVRGGRDGGRGSGLGLAIVRSVAESHGGSVTLAPPVAGQGTRFEIRLPALGVDDDAAPEIARESPDGVDVNERAAARALSVGRRRRVDQTSTTTGRTIGRRRSRS